jgi:hypothetical protein
MNWLHLRLKSSILRGSASAETLAAFTGLPERDCSQ